MNAGPRHRFVVSGALVHNCLACGYSGWVGAFQRFAVTFGIVVPDEQAADICAAWREAHPEIVDLWHATLGAAIQTVETGRTTRVRHIGFHMERDWLRMDLPSGRSLAYYRPQTVEVEKFGKMRKVIQFWGVDSKTHKWSLLSTYGGKLIENATQAVARDLLAFAIRRLVRAGAPVILSVHDELVLESPLTAAGNHENLCRSMCVLPKWADGMPVAAEGWTGFRYRK